MYICKRAHEIPQSILSLDSSDSYLVQEELQEWSLQLLDHSLRLQAAHTHTHTVIPHQLTACSLPQLQLDSQP